MVRELMPYKTYGPRQIKALPRETITEDCFNSCDIQTDIYQSVGTITCTVALRKCLCDFEGKQGST